MARSQIEQLRVLFGNRCHYCDCVTIKTPKSPRQSTREHVVPKTFGGANSMRNYVLACASCNNKRGNQLFFCKCPICHSLIQEALADPAFVANMFDKIVKHNTPRVYKNGEGVWCVGINHGRTHHVSWEAAMEAAFALGKVEA